MNFCQICWDSTGDVDECIVLPSCKHAFCRSCLTAHSKRTIEASRKRSVVCPQYRCTKEIARSSVMKLIEEHENTREVLLRLDKLHENPSFFSCPACEHLMDPNEYMASNMVRCPRCLCSFCKIHGQSHTGLTCKQFYQTFDYQQQQESERIIEYHTIPCSRCGARLQKTAGCNYVVCGQCKGDMCYYCRTHKYLNHTGKNDFRYCRRCLTALGEGSPGCCLSCYFFCVILVIIFVWPIVAVLAVILSGCCCCCFCGGRWGTPNAADGRFNMQRGARNVLTVLCLPVAYITWGTRVEDMIPRFLAIDRRVAEIPSFREQTSYNTNNHNDNNNTTMDTSATEVILPWVLDNDDDDEEVDVENQNFTPPTERIEL